jgi:hypothetical protein
MTPFGSMDALQHLIPDSTDMAPYRRQRYATPDLPNQGPELVHEWL